MSEYPNSSDSLPASRIEKPKSTTAMISLIAGILGLTVIPFIGSVIAVMTGFIAMEEIDKSEGSLGGEGMAQAGKILGWIGIGLTVLSFCLAGVIIAFSFCFLGIGLLEAFSAITQGMIGFI